MFIALFTVRYALSVQQRRVHFAGQEEMQLLEEDEASQAEEVTRPALCEIVIRGIASQCACQHVQHSSVVLNCYVSVILLTCAYLANPLALLISLEGYSLLCA